MFRKPIGKGSPLNVLFISPNFPPQYYLFCAALRERGVKVLGIGDAPFHSLRWEQQQSLSEYVHVPRMESYDDLLRAAGALTGRHGKIDRIDSLTEHWLGLEAKLREDFNVAGLRPAQVDRLRRKSAMAEIFKAAGIPAPALERVASPAQVRAFALSHGFPVVIKPDCGVGAAGAFRVGSMDQLEAALSMPLSDMVVQEFVQGRITSFDGLADAGGEIAFCTSFVYSSGVMEIVADQLDAFYASRRAVPAALEEYGRRAVAAFGIKERFFHIEFFELPDGSLRALEVNLRPPGGFTTDLMNWSCDTDVYRLWAGVITGAPLDGFAYERRYHAAHVARRRGRRYRRPHRVVAEALGSALLDYRELGPPISVAMGDAIYLVRFRTAEELEDARRLIQEAD